MEAATQKDEQQKDEQKGDGDGHIGTVEEIQGVVVEVAFPDELPEIYNALEGELKNEFDEEEQEVTGEGSGTLVLEEQQHLSDDRVRAVAMGATDGLSPRANVRDTGGPITVGVIRPTLGRL